MSRPARLLATLGVISLLGIGALTYLARQYEKRAAVRSAGEDPTSRAARLVSGFLAAGGGEAPAPAALAQAGLTREEYDLVRRAALARGASGAVGDEPLAAAIAARAGEVEAALGR